MGRRWFSNSCEVGTCKRVVVLIYWRKFFVVKGVVQKKTAKEISLNKASLAAGL